MTGTGETLKKELPDLKIHAVEPAESPFFSGGKPGPHKIQGIGAGFMPEIFNREMVDRIVLVSYEHARAASRRLAELEGILCGVSSGAILHAALGVAQDLGRESVCWRSCRIRESATCRRICFRDLHSAMP